jgi:DNA-binding CsgD family transcriptional regulator
MNSQKVTGGRNDWATRRARQNPVRLSDGDRRVLERWIRGQTTAQRVVLRSRIVLLVAGGMSSREAARRLGVSRHTVDLWRTRFAQGGCDALTFDKPGRGRKPRGQAICGDARDVLRLADRY